MPQVAGEAVRERAASSYRGDTSYGEEPYETTDELPVIEQIRERYAEPRRQSKSQRRLAERAERLSREIDAMAVPIERRASTPAHALMIVPTGPWLVQVENENTAGHDLGALVEHASRHGGVAERTVVLTADGRPLGWIARDDLINAVSRALA